MPHPTLKSPHPQIIIEKHVVIIQNLDLLFLELTTYLRPQAEIFFNKFKLNSFKLFFFPERKPDKPGPVSIRSPVLARLPVLVLVLIPVLEKKFKILNQQSEYPVTKPGKQKQPKMANTGKNPGKMLA
jgi:hypothetical protein